VVGPLAVVGRVGHQPPQVAAVPLDRAVRGGHTSFGQVPADRVEALPGQAAARDLAQHGRLLVVGDHRGQLPRRPVIHPAVAVAEPAVRAALGVLGSVGLLMWVA
jgi:hypothetical protein